jgi:hypothetical protein
MKTFRFKVPALFSSVNAADVSQWLEQTLASGAPLSPDCGPGDAWLGVELDESAVARLVEREGESPTQVLRRLLVTRIPSASVQTELAGEKHKEKPASDGEFLAPKSELPRKMQLDADDLLPVAKLIAAGERALLRWQMGIPKSVHLPEDDAADRELAAVSATVANSRAPVVFTRNADLIKASLVLVRHAWSSYEIAERYAREHAKEQAGRVTAAAVPASAPVSGSPVSASVRTSADAPVRVAIRSELSPSPVGAEIHTSLDNLSDDVAEAYRMELEAARRGSVSVSANPSNPSLDKF